MNKYFSLILRNSRKERKRERLHFSHNKKRAEEKKFLLAPENDRQAAQAGLTTAPERMQRVHTRKRAVCPPSVTVLTFCRFGYQRRLVLLWAWLTLLPVTGPFPQISHLRAMIYMLLATGYLLKTLLYMPAQKRQRFFHI
jgi:hypothetical protein